MKLKTEKISGLKGIILYACIAGSQSDCFPVVLPSWLDSFVTRILFRFRRGHMFISLSR